MLTFRQMAVSFAIAILLCIRPNGAAAEEKMFNWKAACDQVKDVVISTADKPSPAEAKSLQGCSSEDLYYGITRTSDPDNARKCAYVEFDHGDEKVFGGSSMLMTIYANGNGGERNFDLAIKFACRLDGAPAEMAGRIKNLTAKKIANWTGNNFSLCDNITSGYMAGYCEAHRERFKEAERKRNTEEITAKWSEADRKAFERLRKAADKYFDLRSSDEVDLSGTARAAFEIEEHGALEKDFLSLIESLERADMPIFSVKQFEVADAELNAAYQKIQKTPHFEYGTVTKEGIKKTQRAWIAYRDAWVAFASGKYRITLESIKTQLTQKRTDMLSAFFD